MVAKKDYTVEFYHKDNTYYGLIHTYAKVEERCVSAVCNQVKSCNCALAHEYYAILEVLDIDDDQLSQYRGMTVVDHITQVKASNRWEKGPLCSSY